MTLLRTPLTISRTLQFVRRFSSEKQYQEISIPVPWGVIRGKWWGPTDIRPILTLHGWQDNCGSFDRLIPLLNKNVAFLAIDLPGHGYSSHIPAGMYYHFSTYLLTIKYIISYLTWPKVTLMGHSMGGIICYLYTMLYPQAVDFLACIEGMKPLMIKNPIGNMPRVINEFIRSDAFSMSLAEPPSYTIKEIANKVHAPNNGSIDLDVAHHVIERNVAPSKSHPGKFYFTRDPRLKSFELLPFFQLDMVKRTEDVTCPVFITKSKEGSYYESKENFYKVLEVLRKSSKDCRYQYVQGKHHVHLNSPQEIAELLCHFINKHNTEDRRVGGIKEEMIVSEERGPVL